MLDSNDNDKAREKALQEVVPPYSLPTRIGQWNDNLFLEEAKNHRLLEKMKRNELLVQRTRLAMWNLCRSVKLTNEMTHLMYGHAVQIRAPDVDAKPCFALFNQGPTKFGLYLSAVLTPREIINGITNITTESPVALSEDRTPCVRNTFMFWHQSNCSMPQNTIVQYNDPLYICNNPCDPETEQRLYLTTRMPWLDDPPTPNYQFPVYFTNTPDTYSRWIVQHWNPNLRLESMHTQVPANTRLVITNVASGRNLAVESSCWFLTFFGRECSATCHTIRDTHRMETAANIWEFVTEQPQEYISIYDELRRGRDALPDKRENVC